MNSIPASFIRSQKAARALPPWLIALAATCTGLAPIGCGAEAQDNVGSTDTGNPPLIDQQSLRVESSDTGVVVSAAAGGVSPGGATVEVTNLSTGTSASTTAATDGSFEVALAGSVDDEFRVEVEAGGKRTSVALTNDPTALSGLVGHRYLLDSATGFTPVPDTTVSVHFDETEFGFSAGCNSHSGSYTFCGGRLCIDGMGSTEIGCDAALHAQDEWLADFFTSTPELERAGDRVTVTGEDATLSFLDREVANPDRPLTGRLWTIDTFIRGGGASNFPLQAAPTVEFTDDGTVQVFTTCANGGGEFEVIGQTLVFSGIAYTEEGCGETGNQTAHDHIVEVLSEGECTFGIDAARLTIERGAVGLSATTE